MFDNDNFYFDDPEFEALLNRYQALVQDGQPAYFEMDDFESIIDYFAIRGEMDYAQRAIAEAQKQHPNDAGVLLCQAEIYIATDRYEDAWKIVQQLSKSDIGEEELQQLKSIVLIGLGRVQEGLQAMENIQKAADLEEKIMLWSGLVEFLQKRNLSKFAIIYAQQLCAIDPEEPGWMLTLARCYRDVFDIRNSAKWYKKFLKKEPDATEVMLELGDMYRKGQLHQKALDAYNNAIDADEECWEAYSKIGQLFTSLDQYADAKKIYLEMLALRADSTEALYGVGINAVFQNHWKEAISYFQQAIAADPYCHEAYYGLSLVAGKQEHLAQQIELLSYAVTLSPADTHYLFHLAKTYFKKGDIDAAIDTLLLLVQIDPTKGDAWIMLACAQSTGNKNLAIETLKTALKHLPQAANISCLLATFYYKNQDISSCTTYLKQAIKAEDALVLSFFESCPEAILNPHIVLLCKQYSKLFGLKKNEQKMRVS